MTEEEQNIAILKNEGWTYSKSWWLSPKDEAKRRCAPDYVNDLNLVHQLEKTLDPIDFLGYRKVLFLHALKEREDCMCASAAQRVKAYLIHHGLWVESPPEYSTSEMDLQERPNRNQEKVHNFKKPTDND